MKHIHEFRDPVHVFVRLDSDERRVVDSRAFQRLRHIHQLALSSLVYPGASHKRFEHSLGVMELAGRVFDVVANEANVSDEIRHLLPEISHSDKKVYWRRVLRMAALCHDLGHLPFSHAAEKELLPSEHTHEDISREIILSDEMQQIWQSMTPPLRAEDVAKLAIGPNTDSDHKFSNWEAILSEIIVGDAFGVDRIDYLLRDSLHCGVPYGRFDHYRLIDTIRILPSSPSEAEAADREPTLGVQVGGIHTAEALLLARYFMYCQVYFHPIRRIYDIHLKDFLEGWLADGKFPTDVDGHLSLTDNEVWSGILAAYRDQNASGHQHANRIIDRRHYRELYARDPSDVKINPEAGNEIFEAAEAEFGSENVRSDRYSQKSSAVEFPVLMNDGRIASSISLSETLRQLPIAKFEYVFVEPGLHKRASDWLDSKRDEIIRPKEEDET